MLCSNVRIVLLIPKHRVFIQVQRRGGGAILANKQEKKYLTKGKRCLRGKKGGRAGAREEEYPYNFGQKEREIKVFQSRGGDFNEEKPF